MSVTLRREGLWSLVIAVNLLILGFIGHRVIRAMENSAGSTSEMLAWSDQVPALGTYADVHGENVRLDPVEQYLVLLLFDAQAAGPVDATFHALAETLPESAPVRFAGIFAGSAADYAALGLDVSAPVVADPAGELRRKLGLSEDPAVHHTLVVRPDATADLVFQGVLPAHLLVDYLWREALGRSDAPPDVQIRTESLVDIAAAPEAAHAASEGLPSGLDLSLAAPVEQVSEISAFRLRRAPDGRLWALSRTENRIVELGPDLAPMSTLGGFGQAPGRLMMPSDLDFDEAGRLVVLDSGNGRLQVLDPDGGAARVIELNADVVSLAVLSEHQVMLAMPGGGSTLATLDPTRAGAAPRAVGSYAEIPWLRERVEGHFEPSEYDAAYEGLQGALSRTFVRRHPDGGLLAVPIWQPTVRRLDAEGRVVSEVPFTFSGMEEKTELFEETLQEALDKRHLGILYLFQDLSLGADGRSIGLTVVGDCPGVLLLGADAEVTHELCLEAEDGSRVAPVTLAPEGPDSWWIGNAKGIYRLVLG